MSEKLTEHFKQFEGAWLRKFLTTCFGKNGYTHSASLNGFDTYLSNLRPVWQSDPTDYGCVRFLVYDGDFYELFNMVDYHDDTEFLRIFTRYLNLKAFI